MMCKIGNFLFRYRNGLFPLTYFLLLIDQSRLWDNDVAAAVAGFVVSLAGQSLRGTTIGLIYIIRGGKNRQVYAEKLVTKGMFAHCRNPLYVGNILILAGVAVAANSTAFLAVGLPLFLFAYRCIVAAEEQYLEGKFGAEFSEYCRRVNRFIPDFSGIGRTLEETEFSWKRLMLKDYGTIFYWSAGIVCIVGKNTWLHAGYDSGRETFWTLGVLLTLLILSYATARYLKKSGKVQAA